MAEDSAQQSGQGVNPPSDDTALSASPAEQIAVTPPAQEPPVQPDVKSEQYVPYNRFKEMVDKVHSLESALPKPQAVLPQTPEKSLEAWQPKDWDDVLSEVTKRAKTELQSEQQKKQEEQQKASNYIETSLKEFESQGKVFDRNKFLVFALELADKGMGDIKTAFSLYEQINKQDNAKDIAKAGERGKLAARTASPVQEPAATNLHYAKIHNRSLDEIIADSLEQ
mgnify:CR=1 FL=1